MNIIGISSFYHDSACCLLQNGKLLAAASEERFSRIKNDASLPVRAFRYCLREAGLDITDVDHIAYYEFPEKKLDRQLYCGLYSEKVLAALHRPRQAITECLGYQGPIAYYDHHQSHAASSFYYSGFKEAAILCVDGVGEWATTSYGFGKNTSMELFEEVVFPHSLGLLYATFTAYLGFKVNSDEYKVMGLASYGQPCYINQIRHLISVGEKGQFQLNMRYFEFPSGQRMFSDKLPDLLGAPARLPESAIEPFHQNIAKSLQTVLEEVLLEKVAYLHQCRPSENLCLAGGVALNCVANGRIQREGPFKRLFVQPAAGDAGAALGAAALCHYQFSGKRSPLAPMVHAYLGPQYENQEIAAVLADCGLPTHNFRNRQKALIKAVVQRLLENKVIGWFQGRMEFGPRALGARSILANPLDPQMRDRLNLMVKKREAFRPFAPAVLMSHAQRHFELAQPSPFMLQTCPVRSPLDLMAITHVDGSSRPQTVNHQQAPLFAALLEAFFKATGCPMLVNTSFNMRGEPIVCSPTDALMCMSNSGLDCLVLGDFLLDHNQLPDHWQELLPSWQVVRRSGFNEQKAGISEHLYTFV